MCESEFSMLQAEVERLKTGHCRDCCCAQSWAALGITEMTGLSIPEEIEKLKAENVRLQELHAAVDWYIECSKPGSRSQYISKNGRYGKSPWVELIEAAKTIGPTLARVPNVKHDTASLNTGGRS
ncbi:MAG: hypothetical protein ABIH76_06985, partial [Candidatus Bathyarchaeota archaeon]